MGALGEYAPKEFWLPLSGVREKGEREKKRKISAPKEVNHRIQSVLILNKKCVNLKHLDISVAFDELSFNHIALITNQCSNKTSDSTFYQEGRNIKTKEPNQ